MKIRRNIGMGGNKLAAIIMVVACIFTSCIKENSNIDKNGAGCQLFPEGTNTYFNFILRLGDSPETKGGPAGDTVGTAEESAVKNVFVIFFDNNDKFETSSFFDVSQLTLENGTGNLGSSVTNGYTFTKAIPIMAGKKSIFAVVNANSNILPALQTFLVKGVTTVSQFNNYEVNLLPAISTYPLRLNLPKYDNYVAPTPMGILQLNRLGTDGIEPSATDGMLMSGCSAANFESGVSQTEATKGQKNLVTIYVDRLAAKATLYFDEAIGYEAPALSSGGPNFKVYQPSGSVSIDHAYWWIANMPAKGYMNEQSSSPYAPYYDEHSVFSMWQNKYPYANTPETDNHTVTFDKNVAAYFPENLVSTPVRGNVSYIAVKAKFTFGGDKDAYFLRGLVNYKFWWKWYNLGENPNNPGREGFVYSSTSGVPMDIQLCGTWMIIDENQERDYIPYTSTKNWSTLMDYFNYRISSTTNDPVTNVLMSTYDKSKTAQDAALLAQIGGATIPAGWYAFSYEAKTLHTNHWYDEMQLYYYTGTQKSGEWLRGEQKNYTLAYYTDNYCYYRINLEDMDKPLKSIERYAVHRNDWFDVKITKINDIGYPDEEDLASNPDDDLSSSWLEVQISVQNWRNGGNQSGTIGR